MDIEAFRDRLNGGSGVEENGLAGMDLSPAGLCDQLLWGRKPLTETDPGLLDALDGLVEPQTRGDPMTRLRWTTKSTRNLADELGGQGHQVSHHRVGRLLAGPLGTACKPTPRPSKAASTPTVEGRQHPDRDGQFGYVNDQVSAASAALAAGEPVVSVDAKRKLLVGEYANKGPHLAPGRGPPPGRGPRLPRRGGQGRALRGVRPGRHPGPAKHRLLLAF